MSERIKKIIKGDVQEAATLITEIENDPFAILEELKELYQHSGKAYVIGITGAPGTGKSSLIDILIDKFRNSNMKVGVIAVDPTSRFSGGAILGDRIRMHRHSNDNGVFIRSLATRRHFGGLTETTAEVVRVMDAMGKDVIIIETVGVGQEEIEIASLAHTTIIVTIPGMGDNIQLMKAGITEIADIFVINKADHEGADKTVIDLEMMGNYSPHLVKEESWKPLIFKTIATTGYGVDELVKGIYKHKELRQRMDIAGNQQEEKIKSEFMEIAKSFALELAKQKIDKKGGLNQVFKEMVEDKIDPYKMVERIFSDC